MKDLLSCRLVNTYWYGIVMSVLRKRTGYIRPGNTTKKLIQLFHCIDMSEKLLGRKFAGWPFGKITINEAALACNVDFWGKAGPWITELRIRLDKSNEFSPITSPLTGTTFPKLKKLELKFPSLSDPTCTLFTPQHLEYVLKNSTTLRELIIVGTSRDWNSWLIQPLKNLTQCQLARLQRLQLLNVVLNDLIKPLAEIGLQLKTLRIRHCKLTIEGGPILRKKFLESQKATLEVLNVRGDWEDTLDLDGTSLPQLLNLKINLWGKITANRPVHYKSQFPNLRRLIFAENSSYCENYQCYFGNPVGVNFAVSGLEKLTLPSLSSPRMRAYAILTIPKQFPNIKKLETDGSSNWIELVTKLNSIEELTLSRFWQSFNIDQMLTGLTADRLKEIREMNGKEEREAVVLEHAQMLEKQPWSGLHKLRVLKVVSPLMNATVTDIAFHMVLLKLRKLECLDFEKIKHLDKSEVS